MDQDPHAPVESFKRKSLHEPDNQAKRGRSEINFESYGKVFPRYIFSYHQIKPIVFEYIGDDEQRFLICQWILDNVTRFGWGGAGSTPVPASEKKKVWAELWSYSNQQV